MVQSFGRHHLPKYATYTLCNGVRLDVPSGTPVTAVFGGVVAYAQDFKGYGNMVVVDHGNHVFSLDTFDSSCVTYSRNFSPAMALWEDPASASGSSGLGTYLRHFGITSSGSMVMVPGMQST